METKNTLNGFEAVLDTLIPNVGNINNEDNKFDMDGVGEELTDEELDKIKETKTTKQVEEKVDKEEDTLEEEPTKKSKTKVVEENDTEDDDDDIEPSSNTDNSGSDESEAITAFFDTLSEKLGWDDVEDDEKPKTAEDLVEYFREVIEDNSKPDFASEEIEQLDKFVRNGGNLKDYFQLDADIDIDEINIEGDEVAQKAVVRMLLKEKGFNSNQIEKKINKYEDAGLLEDEAQDAIEDLKEIREEKKKQLLAAQEKRAKDVKRQQQEFFDNVLNEIKGMDNIYGISVPEKDKKALLEYIFKPNSRGVTKYQEDYAKSLKNLITSAYFTMKGDSIISIAKKEGKKAALDNFKNTLTKNTGVNKRSKRTIDNNDNNSIWSTFTRQLRA